MPPKDERVKIICSLHDALIGGHKGINKAYHKIRERYYWKGMRRDITEYVRTISVCNEWKINRIQTKTPLLISDTPLESFQKVSIDTVGILPTTPNRHLLTMHAI